MKKSPGLLFVISAASGTGKTTLVQRLLQDRSAPRFSISHTTRAPRAGEQNGRDYHFVTETEFQKMVDHNAFVEWAAVHGSRYGTSKSELNQAQDLLLDIDTQGALNIKRLYANRAVLIFLAPPSVKALQQRLASRGTESEVQLKKRLEAASRELACQDRYDHVVVNDDVERALSELNLIIMQERARARGGKS